VDLEQHPCLPHRLGSSTWTTLRATASPPPQDQSAILRVRRVGLLRPAAPTRRPGRHPGATNPSLHGVRSVDLTEHPNPLRLQPMPWAVNPPRRRGPESGEEGNEVNGPQPERKADPQGPRFRVSIFARERRGPVGFQGKRRLEAVLLASKRRSRRRGLGGRRTPPAQVSRSDFRCRQSCRLRRRPER